MMLQVDLGAEKRKERDAHEPGAAAVQESRERPAEVQQGERQVGATVEASQALPGKLCRPRTAAKCLRELHSVANAPSPKVARPYSTVNFMRLQVYSQSN